MRWRFSLGTFIWVIVYSDATAVTGVTEHCGSPEPPPNERTHAEELLTSLLQFKASASPVSRRGRNFTQVHHRRELMLKKLRELEEEMFNSSHHFVEKADGNSVVDSTRITSLAASPAFVSAAKIGFGIILMGIGSVVICILLIYSKEVEDNDNRTSRRPRLSRSMSECYEHVGLSHLPAIGSASASLAIVSTLVFSVGITILLFLQAPVLDKAPVLTNYLCVSAACSAYTICYSCLEYYYTQMFKGVDEFITTTTLKSESIETRRNAAELVGEVSRERRELVNEVRTAFASFNNMRCAARNSMWLGLVCLFISVMVRIDIVKDLAPDFHPSSSTSASLFFASILALVGPAWYKLRYLDLKMYSFYSAAGLLATAAEALLIKSEFPTSKLVALVTLALISITVPLTVLSIRAPLLPLVRRHVDIY